MGNLYKRQGSMAHEVISELVDQGTYDFPATPNRTSEAIVNSSPARER
jgi:hypothetical protein